MNDWVATKTSDEQGAAYREVKVNGKVSQLEFTVIPHSDYWRAGFKLIDPNSQIFPLRNDQSFLFHLGSTTSKQEYGYTAYLNGELLKSLNKTKKYPLNNELRVKLDINHNNFVKIFVNGSLEFKSKWHFDNPDIREKTYLIGWGDENDYRVDFEDIQARNWKDQQQLNQVYPSIKENSKHTPWYKNLIIWGLIIAGCSLGVGIISIPWWPHLVSFFSQDQNKRIQSPSTPVDSISKQKSEKQFDPLRSLEPLETGKKIGQLPDNVYFFASPLMIKYELDDPKIDFLSSSNLSRDYYFEIQKKEGRYYIIGFISDEAQSKLGSIKDNSLYTILFPDKWGGASHCVAIPFDAIYTIQTRTIDLDQSKSIEVFDIGFKDVVENPAFHKYK